MMGLMAGAVCVVVAEAEVVVPVAVPVAVPEVVDDADGGGPVPSSWYRFRRWPSPQYSVVLSLQVMPHWVIAVGTAPARKSLPQ
jgi:hypothetical protein